MSDDDVREELRREQQQQLLAASQVCLYEGPGVYAWRMLSRAQRPDVAGGTGPMWHNMWVLNSNVYFCHGWGCT
jgi:hypothetical protein